MWKWLLRWEYANCSQGWIYNLPCPLYRLSIVYITEIDCSWSSCTENKWNLNWTQHTHKYKRDKQFTQIHNWPAQMIREFSKCKFLLTPTKYHFLKACHWSWWWWGASDAKSAWRSQVCLRITYTRCSIISPQMLQLRIFRVSRQFANTRQKNAANPVTGAFASYLLCICTIDWETTVWFARSCTSLLW